MADYTLDKDADVTLTETVQDADGNAIDLTGATITWMVVRLDTSLAGDLDSVSSLVSLDNDTEGSVSISDAANGQFEVALEDTDLSTLAPDIYRIVVRVKQSDNTYLGIDTYTLELTA